VGPNGDKLSPDIPTFQVVFGLLSPGGDPPHDNKSLGCGETDAKCFLHTWAPTLFFVSPLGVPTNNAQGGLQRRANWGPIKPPPVTLRRTPDRILANRNSDLQSRDLCGEALQKKKADLRCCKKKNQTYALLVKNNRNSSLQTALYNEKIIQKIFAEH